MESPSITPEELTGARRSPFARDPIPGDPEVAVSDKNAGLNKKSANIAGSEKPRAMQRALAHGVAKSRAENPGVVPSTEAMSNQTLLGVGSMIKSSRKSRAPLGMRRTASLPNLNKAHAAEPIRLDEPNIELLRAGPSPYLNLQKVIRQKRGVKYDREVADAFGAEVVKTVNDASTCVLISLGHQLGLFAVMAKLNDRPRSAQTIAVAANNLRPRYVQELLSALSCAGIVEETLHDPPAQECKVSPVVLAAHQLLSPNAGSTVQSPVQSTNTLPMTNNVGATKAYPRRSGAKYRLPPEHALFLTWGSGQDNLALLTQYIPVLGRVEDEVVQCFRSGEGLDWTRFGQFDLVSELDLSQTLGPISRFETEVLGLVPGLARTLRDGVSVLCIGSGIGSTFSNLAVAFPKSWFTLYEANPQKANVASSAHDDIPNVHFRSLGSSSKCEPDRMVEKRAYSAAFIIDGSVVRDSHAPSSLLRRIRSALKPDSPLLYFEYNVKTGREVSVAGPLLYGISTFQSIPLSITAGGPALGRVWGATSAGYALKNAGFTHVEYHSREGDTMNVVLVATVQETESGDDM